MMFSRPKSFLFLRRKLNAHFEPPLACSVPLRLRREEPSRTVLSMERSSEDEELLVKELSLIGGSGLSVAEETAGSGFFSVSGE